MRNLLALCGAAVITFAGVGWYLDWFRVHPSPSSEDGKRNFQIEVNKAKISDDLHKGGTKLHGFIEKKLPDTKAAEKPPSYYPMDTATDGIHQVKAEGTPPGGLPDLLPPGPPVPEQFRPRQP
jgi:hypothetical protein